MADAILADQSLSTAALAGSTVDTLEAEKKALLAGAAELHPADLDQWNACYAGTEAALANDGQGYRAVSINGRSYRGQRIA